MAGLVHQDLVARAAKWLARRHSVIITDMASAAGEQPDAIGWGGLGSTLIECKASRADFLADKNKPHRGKYGMGTKRYYMAPIGILATDEMPEGWGLLVVTERGGVQEIRKAIPRISAHAREVSLLLSALRRIGQNPPEGISVKCYTIETGRTATIGILPEAS